MVIFHHLIAVNFRDGLILVDLHKDGTCTVARADINVVVMNNGCRDYRHTSSPEIGLPQHAAILRRELLYGEPENELLAKMLAHICERAAEGDETAQVTVEAMEPEVRAVLARVGLQ